MIDLNNNISNLQQLEIQTKNVENFEEIKKNFSVDTRTTGNSPATETEISKLALSKINELISKEDGLALSYYDTKEIYNSLTNIRTELASFMQSLQNTHSEHNADSLIELDNKSNELIDKVFNILKDKNLGAIIDTKYTNIFLNGLGSLKKMSIKDDNYLVNIENLISEVINKQNNYQKMSEELYSKITENSNDFEKLASNEKSNNNIISSSELQKEIVLNFNETINSVTNGLTPETVLRLLQG